jgi:tetratricopeptide (TPR) repeat protein
VSVDIKNSVPAQVGPVVSFDHIRNLPSSFPFLRSPWQERGEAFYKIGEYEKAMNEYREAYLLSKAPLFLLNIAQCYRYMGEYDEAKHNYEALLREDPNTA